jgi:transposase-like protein
MANKKRTFTPEFKFKVVLEVLKEEKTLNQIASEHELVPSQLSLWKKDFLEGGASVFGQNHTARDKAKDFDKIKANMERKIGELTLSVDFLKKKYAENGWPIKDENA